MEGSRLILAVSSGAFIATAGFMGLRLMWLARRTRHLPEVLVGTGFALMCFLAVPFMGMSGMGRAAAGDVGLPSLVIGMAALWLGVSCLIAFTRAAFRPREGWAAWLTAMLIGSMALLTAGTLTAVATSPPQVSSFEAGKFWTGSLRFPVIVMYVWTSWESLRQWRMARRRLAIGIGDPTVANRFLLWGLVGASQLVVHGVSLGFHLRGVGLLAADPISFFVVACGGLVGAVLMFLAFLPPASYLAYIERRAKTS